MQSLARPSFLALGALLVGLLAVAPARAGTEGDHDHAAARDDKDQGVSKEETKKETKKEKDADKDKDWEADTKDRARRNADDGRGRGGGPQATAGTANNGLPDDLDSKEQRAKAQALSASGAMVSVQLGYGTANADGLGVGARGGYLMRNRVWIGGVTEYNFGRSNTLADFRTSTSRFLIGPEIGYALNAGPVVIRPYVSAGLAVLGNSVKSIGGTATPIDESENTAKFYVMPGAAVQVPIQNFFVGGDARVLVMRNQDTSLGLFGTAGFRL